MIIGEKIVTPDIWEEIKDLELIDGLNHLYKRGYFEDAPTHDADGKPYDSIFETGVRFHFEIFQTFDYEEEMRQLEYLMGLKHKYNRSYDEQLKKLAVIHEKLKVLNALHE